MAALRETATGHKVMLEAEHVIGRVTAPRCSLTLNEPYVSGVHAMLRWNGHEWELKDLSSRNGTFVDGRRIEPSVFERVRTGSRIAFGRVEQEWELVDELGPPVMAVPLDGGDAVLLDGELIPLPSSSDPRSTIYRTSAGTWILEHQDGAAVPVTNMQTFEAAGRLWRFCCSEMSPATLGAPGVSLGFEPDVNNVHLTFSVSSDEEYVHLRMTCGTRLVDLGERGHNYLLLTLARRRRDDAKEGLPDTSCGWMDQEVLSRDPSVLGPQLNLSVFRIREQFAREGVQNAGKIIERRSNPRQLRLGTARFSIVTV
jgi:hypothetical protein